MEVRIELTEPIETGDETVSELTLRRPDGKVIRELGFPYSFGSDGDDFTINTKVCAKYICRLAAVPSSLVDKIAPSDFQDLCVAIVDFFKPGSDQTKA